MLQKVQKEAVSCWEPAIGDKLGFSAVKDKSSSLWEILLLLGCATGLQMHSAECCRSTLSPWLWAKTCSSSLCRGESPHPPFLASWLWRGVSTDLWVYGLLWPWSGGTPKQSKEQLYSASLDKVGFLTWDTGVGPSMWNTWGVLNYQAVKQAFCWAPEPLFCFPLCYEWLEVIEWSSVNLEFTESQNILSWKGLTGITETRSWVNDPYGDGIGDLGITRTNLWASEKSFG